MQQQSIPIALKDYNAKPCVYLLDAPIPPWVFWLSAATLSINQSLGYSHRYLFCGGPSGNILYPLIERKMGLLKVQGHVLYTIAQAISHRAYSGAK